MCEGGSVTQAMNTLRLFPQELVDEARVRKVMREMTSSRESGEGELLAIRHAFVKYFDPEHPHTPRKDAEASMESVRARRKDALNRGGGRSAPVIDSVAVPRNTAFSPVRGILFCSLMVALLERSLNFSQLAWAEIGSAGPQIVGRVVHLLTLQLHCRDEAATDFWALLNSDSGRNLLGLLARVFVQGVFDGDELYRQGLESLLSELSAAGPPSIADLLITCGVKLAGSDPSLDKSEVLQKRKQAAQKRAAQMISQSASSFAEEMQDLSDNDEGDEGKVGLKPSPILLEHGASACVVCKVRAAYLMLSRYDY
jgi:hypothetical protein